MYKHTQCVGTWTGQGVLFIAVSAKLIVDKV